MDLSISSDNTASSSSVLERTELLTQERKCIYRGRRIKKKCHCLGIMLLIFSIVIPVSMGTYGLCFDEELKQYLACSPPMNDIIDDQYDIGLTLDPADSTCGTPASTFRRVEDRSNTEQVCDASVSGFNHPPGYMIDLDETTWWQSISRTTSDRNLPITISLSFGKMFRLAGMIVLTFNYARPDMMVLDKSVDNGQTWMPVQYFARFCDNFQDFVSPSATFTVDDPMAVVCNPNYVESSSRIRSGRRVTYDLDERFALFWGEPVTNYTNLYINLQTKMLDDLLFTNLRIRLLRPYTDGSPDYDKFFYAIQNLNVVARCYCNLHAPSCSDVEGNLQCDCAHNTEGVSCERCKPLYNERLWQRGSYIPFPSGTANECVECECNNHSLSCTYDASYERGICNDCLHNTQGRHCQDCQDGFYPNVTLLPSDVDRCVDCNCYAFGVDANNSVCNRDLNSNLNPGQCVCKSLVTNLRCDSCISGYYGLMLNPLGDCKACECDPDGTKGQSNTCTQEAGQCPCKTSTTGRQCDICADTFFAFPTGNPQGSCTACGCNAGGSVSMTCNKQSGSCTCKTGISGTKCDNSVAGSFTPLIDTLVYEPASGDCQQTSDRWTASKPFDGTGFALCDLSTSAANIVFEEVAGGMIQVALSWPYFVAVRYTNISPHTITGTVTLTVLGDTSNSLSPLGQRLVTPIAPGCLLSSETTEEIPISFKPGQSTASIATDNRFQIDARCKYSIKLSLNPIEISRRRRKRATIPENGIQIDSVMLLPSLSSSDESQKLVALTDSNDEAATIQQYKDCIEDLAILTTRVQTLTNQQCKNLLFTVSSDVYNAVTVCGCDGNGANLPEICSSLGGQCDCKAGVTGRMCDTCLPGYFNLTDTGCQPCDCYAPGSETGKCDVVTGQCDCKTNIMTLTEPPGGTSNSVRTCRQCLANFFGLDSGNGCSACNCNSQGSMLLQCNDDGQCPCKGTVQGLKCDACKDSFFGFGADGCSACECNESGSTSANCDQGTGVCVCKNNSLGEKCDSCSAGHFNLASYNPEGCQPCFCFEHSTTCTSASGFQLSRISVSDPSGSNALLGVRHTSYGKGLQFSLAADFILDISGEVLVTIEGANGKIIQHLGRENSLIPRDELLLYQVHLFEQYWLLQVPDASPVVPTALQMYGILADISTVTFIDKSKGQAVRVSQISLETAEANETTTEPVQFVESCSCQPVSNVQGLSCEICAVGFRRPEDDSRSSFASCLACNCNNKGSTDPPECDEVTGTCLNCRNGTTGDNCEKCAPFVTGAECDTCESEFWGLSLAGCMACNCSLPGATSSICDRETGQCVCADHVVGRTCDKCEENFHNLTADGCIECDGCYSLLKVEIAELRTTRDNLVTNVTLVVDRDAAFGNLQPFVDRFRVATEETNKLINFLESARVAEVEVVDNITSLSNSLEAIEPQLVTIDNSSLNEIEGNLSLVDGFITTAQEQRQKLVTSATEASNKLVALQTSSATITNLADDLQKVMAILQNLAEASSSDRKLLEELSHLNTTAHTASDLSSILFKRVQEANKIQQNTTTTLLHLDSEILALMAKVTETENTARSLSISSQESSISAAKLQINLAEIQAFTINFSDLKEKIENVETVTSSIEIALQDQKTTFDSENTVFQATTVTVQSLTNETDTVGNLAAALVTRATKAEQKMLSIQENVNLIFASAESARDILGDFSARAAAIEAESQTALEQVASVHESSQRLINETQALSQSLAVLQQVASNTHQISEQALQAIQPKLAQMQGVSTKAVELKNTLARAVPGFEERTNDIESIKVDVIAPADITCRLVQTSITDFQTKLAQAKESADTALGSASNVTSKANQILTDFRSLQRVDGASVDRLLEDVNTAESNLSGANMRVIIKSLIDFKAAQQAEIEALTKKKDDLKVKVERLQTLQQQIRPV